MFVQFEQMHKIKLNDFLFVPLDCPVCSKMLRKKDVMQYFVKHGCCEDCFFDFVEANREEWELGHRPPKDEIDRVLKNRSKVPIYIMRG